MITAITPRCARNRGLPSNSLLQRSCATGVLGRWSARTAPARDLGDGRDPPGRQGGGGRGASEGHHRRGREARGDGTPRGRRRDGRRGTTRRQARRRPLHLHLGRRADLQGRQLLPAAVLARAVAGDDHAMYALNFYSPMVADQLRSGRKTATIRLGDKSRKYRKGMIVQVLAGTRFSPRQRIFDAVIDKVEVKTLADLSPREIEHDNPEIRRVEEMAGFLGQLYNREVGEDAVVTVIRFSEIKG